jgi:hypothetical protein
VVKAVYAVTASIAAISRIDKWLQLNITSVNVGNPVRNIVITEDFYEGGFGEDAAGNMVGIISSTLVPATGVKLYLNWWPYTLAVAQNITVYPGCRRIIKDCHERFENLPNFFGTPFVPNNNPAIDGINT